MNKIDILELINGQYTYANWSSGSMYELHGKPINDKEIVVYYTIKKAIMKKTISRVFTRYINLTPSFCWALGFFRGEGLSSRRSKSYHRFNITNKNPVCLKKFLKEIDKSGLLLSHNIKGKCFQIHHFMNRPEIVEKYWSDQLGFPLEMFSAIDYDHNLSKEGNGVCHFDIGDVLLRRIIDLINDSIIAEE